MGINRKAAFFQDSPLDWPLMFCTHSIPVSVSTVISLSHWQAVSQPCGHDLDSKSAVLSRAADRAIWILFSSHPFSLAICRRWAQLLLVLAGKCA